MRRIIVVSLLAAGACGQSSGNNGWADGGSGGGPMAMASSSGAGGSGGSSASATSSSGVSPSSSGGTSGSSGSGKSSNGGSSRAGGSSSGTSASSGSSGSSGTSASSGSSSSGSVVAGDGGPTGMWVLGYYSGWNTDLYPVSEINWAGLTHIVTAFHVPNAQGTSLDDSQAGGPQLIQSVIAAAHGAGKRALASIGGAGAGSAFSGATSSANLAGFVNVLANLVTMYGYDGLDIDWEDTIDNTLLQNFLKALRQKLPNAAITMPVNFENNNSPDDVSVFGTVSQYIDRINIMSYGMSGTWSGWKSWHSSPLHWNNDTATPVAIDSTLDYYLKAGVPAAKLGMGSGFYGQCFTSPVTAPDQALGSSTIAADEASMSYPYIMSNYYSMTAHNYDTAAMVPYLTFASAHGPDKCTYISYEDAQSIAAKGAYAKSKGLGGTIIWTINLGYVSTAPAGQRSPLLDAMQTAFLQ